MEYNGTHLGIDNGLGEGEVFGSRGAGDVGANLGSQSAKDEVVIARHKRWEGLVLHLLGNHVCNAKTFSNCVLRGDCKWGDTYRSR